MKKLVETVLGPNVVTPSEYHPNRWFFYPNAVFLSPTPQEALYYWDTLMIHHQRHLITHAIFHVRALNLFCLSQRNYHRAMTDFPALFFASKPEAIVYIPRVLNKTVLFKETFGHLGKFTTMG